jgi:hypothetical protein
LSLAKDCYSMKLDLLTNATVLDDAIKFTKQSQGVKRTRLSRRRQRTIRRGTGKGNRRNHKPSFFKQPNSINAFRLAMKFYRFEQ